MRLRRKEPTSHQSGGTDKGRQPKNWKCPVEWLGGAGLWRKQGRQTQELVGNVPRTAGRRYFFKLDFDGDMSELRRTSPLRRSLLPLLRVRTLRLFLRFLLTGPVTRSFHYGAQQGVRVAVVYWVRVFLYFTLVAHPLLWVSNTFPFRDGTAEECPQLVYG